MNNSIGKTMKTAVLAAIMGLLAAGCAQQTAKTTDQFEEKYRFVPRIHVEDSSFGLNDMQYRNCFYDQYYNGYWCPRR